MNDKRKFNGLWFTRHPRTFYSKSWADKVADNYRKDGYLARVVGKGRIWLVYYRKK